MKINVKQELVSLDRNDFTSVCDLADKIVLDLSDLLAKVGDEIMLDATKDYIIDLINPDFLDLDSRES